jgi:glucose/arabinose dehydrogenase
MLKHLGIAAISIAGLVSSAAHADNQPVLTGKAAFGDWQADAPGVTRHITADDLDAPFVTPSSSNAPQGATMPPGVTPKLPAGFKAELVAADIPNPRVIRFAPNGDLFVADSGSNLVRVYRIVPGQAKPTVVSVFAKGLDQPYGIAFYPPGPNPQWVYVGNASTIVRFPYKSGDLEASGKPELVADKIPSGHHWTRDLTFSPDGKTLYLAVGSDSNVAEGMSKLPEGGLDAWIPSHALGATWGNETRRADVLAFDPDGKNERVMATGIRNCAGMTVQPETSDLWCVVNERDELGDNVPFDYATHVAPGAYYGWPWYYIGNHEDPRLQAARPDLAGKATVPDVLFQTHSAPLNIAFYEGDQFPADYKGDAFVTMHGSWNRDTRTGYKVVRLKFDHGKPTGEYQDFMTGFVIDKDNVWGRPVGVAVAPDGSLFIGEDNSGTIWRVTYQK